MHWLSLFRAQPEIHHLNRHGKRHGKVNVTFGNVEFEPLAKQRYSDQDEKTQGQHFDRRVPVDKIAEGSGRKHHHPHGNNHCDNHNRHVFSKPHSRNHRIEREDDVDHGNLSENTEITHACSSLMTFRMPFETAVNFVGALANEKHRLRSK